MYATDFFEYKILNAFRGVSSPGASQLFVALFLNSPGETGAEGVEVTYAGYTRAPVTFTAPYEEEGHMCVKNTTDLLWPAAPADVGTARYIGVYDAAVPGSGNLWLYAAISVPLEIKANQQASIYAGDLLFYLSGAFSSSFKAAILNTLRGSQLTGFTPHIALFNGDPEGSGAELSGAGYARPAIAFSAPVDQPGGQTMIVNSERVSFATPLATWGVWAYDGLMDAASGGSLILKNVNPTPETLLKNYVPIVSAGDYKVSLH